MMKYEMFYKWGLVQPFQARFPAFYAFYGVSGTYWAGLPDETVTRAGRKTRSAMV